MSDTKTGTEQTRRYPPNACIRIAAHSKSHRHYLRTPHDTVLSTPATDVEQARRLAAAEYPSHDAEDFEVITDLCRHGSPREGYSGCWSCTQERREKLQNALRWFFGEVPA